MGRKHRHYENRILRRYFDAERRLQAVQSMRGCDGHSRLFAVELFMRDVPAYVEEELTQAEEDCIADDGRTLIPVAVWHPKRGDYDDDLVVMRQKDFQTIRQRLLEET